MENFKPTTEGERLDEDPFITSPPVGVMTDPLVSERSLRQMLPRLQQDINAEWQKQKQQSLKEEITRNLAHNTILVDVDSRIEIVRPFPTKSPIKSRDSKLFCRFHDDIGHETKDCKI